jgi:hypothetical protein
MLNENLTYFFLKQIKIFIKKAAKLLLQLFYMTVTIL